MSENVSIVGLLVLLVSINTMFLGVQAILLLLMRHDIKTTMGEVLHVARAIQGRMFP